MIGHPREELLLAFQDHRLDDRGRRRLAGHLSACQRCRNVVQAHRMVRGVFALEPPFAPDGVFERALASRAGGMLVMLPVAESAPMRRLEWPSRGFMVAMSAVLVLAVGVQVVPMSRVQQVWSGWGAAIADWDLLGGESLLDLHYPLPPVARAAVIIPERIRPVRARYTVSQRTGGEVTSTQELVLELSRETDGWLLNSTWEWPEDRQLEADMSASLDSRLQPTGWHYRSVTGNARGQVMRESFFAVRGDSIQQVYRRTPAPGAGARFDQPYDSTFALPQKNAAPYAVDDAHFHVLFMGFDLHRGWARSIYPQVAPRYWNLFGTRAETFIAVDGDTITTPAGRFATWEVSDLRPGALRRTRIWVSKEHGLVVRIREGEHRGSETVLESVTFP